MFVYIDIDLRPDALDHLVQQGIRQLEQMLARYANFYRLFPEQGVDPA